MQVSLELYVPRKESVADFADKWATTLNRPMVRTISVTRGTSDDYCPDKNLAFLRELKRVAPHLEIISHVTLSHLQPGLLQSLDQIGVHSILALTGDDSRSEFAQQMGLTHSTELLSYIQGNFPHMKCYAAAYPTGHPSSGSSPNSVREARNIAFHKTEACPSVTLVTQWSYGLTSQLRFISSIGQPTLIGYFPFKDLAHAERVALRCGLSSNLLSESDAKGSLHKRESQGDYSWQSRFAFDIVGAKKTLCASLAGFHLFTMNDQVVTDQALQLAESLLKIPELAFAAS